MISATDNMSSVCQHISDRPTSPQAPVNDRALYTCEFRPFCHRHGLSVERENVVVFSVSRLFPYGCPTAILGRIACVIVDAIHRVLRGWTFAHVLEERLKGILPLRAHRNAAPTVSTIGNVLRIVAPLDNLLPSVVLRTVAHSVFESAKPSNFLVDLFPVAAAALSMSTDQVCRRDCRDISATATAQPSAAPEFPFYRFQRCQPSEFLVGEISRPHVGIIS